jgi:molybdenum cofactor synthesis domain-containing protein
MSDRRRDAVVLTVSDGVHRGSRQDSSGDALATLLEEHGWSVRLRRTVPDEADRITAALRDAAADGTALVVSTGGTGLSPRDVTPEATRAAADRPVPGFAERMRAAGRQVTPMADLSRAEAVVVGSTLVINTPGSRKGAVESLEAVLELLPHAVQLLQGDTQQHPQGHGTEGVPGAVQEHAGRAGPASRDEHGHDDGHNHDEEHGHDDGHGHGPADPCALAHRAGVPDERRPGALVAVYASPLSALLLSWGRDLGYRRLVLVEPDGAQHHALRHADEVVASVEAAGIDEDSDVVVTDHGRDDIVDQCEQMLRSDARWLGLMGSARHAGPHEDGLRERGWADDDVDRIERPVGLDIGSKTPPEIALSVLAGIVADRQGRR